MSFAHVDADGWLTAVYARDEPALSLIPAPEWGGGWPAAPGPNLKPRRVAGAWVWQDPRTTAQAWAEIRAARDSLLAATDWVTLRAADQGAAVPAPWVAYRQALRDVPLQPDPRAIRWPVAPA